MSVSRGTMPLHSGIISKILSGGIDSKMERMQMAVNATKVGALATGGGTAVFGLSINEFAAVIGATVAVLTLVMNFWFNSRRLKMERDKMNDECRGG